MRSMIFYVRTLKSFMTNNPLETRKEFKGIPVSPGIACGEAFLHIGGFPEFDEEIVSENQIQDEVNKITVAFNKTFQEMDSIRTQATAEDSLDLTEVLDAQMLILRDTEFINQIKDRIENSHYSALYAFTSAVNENLDMLSRSKDHYMQEMRADIETVANRVLKFLYGEKQSRMVDFENPVILFGAYFNPGEILDMPNLNVVGFVTEKGGPTSHMGLFARSLGIPAIVAVKADLKQLPIGSKVIIDSQKGTVIINPTKKEWEAAQKETSLGQETKLKKLELVSEIPSATRDLHHVEIAANLDLPTSIDDVLASEKVGIGLYRTEFLYLKNTTFPTEEDQYQMYRRIAEKFAPQDVVLRTFDLGGDKLTDYFKSDFEVNPALGWRAIRFALNVPGVFESQLRAMLRATILKNVQIMLPLISNLEEVQTAKKIIKKAMNSLKTAGIKYDKKVKIGIMIETPAAAQIAEHLAKIVDFFSIGTNDLTQYTLAVDRNNLRVAKYFQAFHPAVLNLIKRTVKAGHQEEIPVGICGELAGDPMATKLLVGLGVDSLSMNPASIPVVKNVLPKIDFEEASKFANKIIKMATEKEITDTLLKDYKKNFANNNSKKREFKNA